MATLTETAYYTRKAIKYGAIALVAFIVLKFSLGVATEIWRRLHPPPPPPPTVAFGKLPAIVFPEQEDLSTGKAGLPKLSFRLETIQGGLPVLDDVGKVYFMPQKGPNLLALDRATQKAKKMGFSAPPRSISPTVYTWTDNAVPPTNLKMNIITGNFSLRYAYENDQTLLTQKNLPPNEQAATEAKNFLGTNGLLEKDLVTGRVEFSYLRFVPPNLVSAISLSEADFVRVNIFRTDLDEMRILPPNPKKALISLLFSGSRTIGRRIIEVNYTYFQIERNTFGTYPLKTPTQAWNELQAQRGYIANLGQNEKGEITIRRVYLAYFDPETSQHFLQPIFVFEGDREFYAYVPAVSYEWVEGAPATGD